MSATLRQKRDARQKRFFQEGQRRIKKRLANTPGPERPVPMMTATNIQYEPAHRVRGLNAGGIGAILLLAQKIDLIGEIDRNLHLLKRHLPYHDSDHVLNIEPEDEFDVAGFIPAIEMLGLAEVGIAPQGDSPKAALAAQVDRFVQVDMGLLVRGTVPTAIDQVERFGRVGQRDEQGMITPDPVVIDVNALLALGVGWNHRAVGFDDRCVEEFGGLLSPDAQPRPINEIHQVQDVSHGEAAAEVAGGGRVWDTLSSERVEIHHIIASQFEVFEALAADENIEGDVQDMVGIVIGEVPFEQEEWVLNWSFHLGRQL